MHLILEVLYHFLSEAEKFINELSCTSMIDIIRCDQIDDYIKINLISCKEDIHNSVNNGVLFLNHMFDNRFLVQGTNGKMRCGLTSHFNITPNNSKH